MCCINDKESFGVVLKGKYKILAITKKSKAAVFKDLKAGDVIKITFRVSNTGYNGCSASCEYRINEGKPIKEYLKKVVDWLNRNCEFEEVK